MATPRTINVFIGYSHQDKKYLEDDSLLGYLHAIESDGEASFWFDERITTGDMWSDEIKNKIKKSQIALLLISQAFLNSQYIRKTEIPQFLRQRKHDRIVLFPIILSPCEWERHDWLKETQFLPTDSKTVETNFTTKGKKRVFGFKSYEIYVNKLIASRKTKILRIRPSSHISETEVLVVPETIRLLLEGARKKHGRIHSNLSMLTA